MGKTATRRHREKFSLRPQRSLEYLETIKAKTLNALRCEVTNAIRPADIKRLERLANAPSKGWPSDPAEQTPYSFTQNVISPDK